MKYDPSLATAQMLALLSNRTLMRCLGPLRKLSDSDHQSAHQKIHLHVMIKHSSHIHSFNLQIED